jgi:hypothetical protein
LQLDILNYQIDNLISQFDNLILQLENLNLQLGKSDLQQENPQCLPIKGPQGKGGYRIRALMFSSCFVSMDWDE